MLFQLCKVDEYGMTSIIKTSEDIAELDKESHDLVAVENFENPLNSTDQLKDFESCCVEIYDEGERVDNAFYAGRRGNGKHYLYFIIDGDIKDVDLENTNIELRFYLGYYSKGSSGKRDKIKEHFYVLARSNKLGQEILENNIDSPQFQEKSFYYIRKVG